MKNLRSRICRIDATGNTANTLGGEVEKQPLFAWVGEYGNGLARLQPQHYHRLTYAGAIRIILIPGKRPPDAEMLLTHGDFILQHFRPKAEQCWN